MTPSDNGKHSHVLRQAKAFSEGSDARLAGLPIEANSYPSSSCWRYVWRSGWLDVEYHWASQAGSRPYKPLPPILLDEEAVKYLKGEKGGDNSNL